MTFYIDGVAQTPVPVLGGLATFMPALMLSGFLFDLRSMPTPIRLITYVLPARYYVKLLQTLFLAGNVWRVIVPNMLILAVMATAILRVPGLGDATIQDHITSTADLSAVLFTKLLLPFEVTSVLILVAILGSVALARHGDGERTENK